ncbi:hypothetical protein [Glaciimonas soli]|uniref:Uncharacterized protein n=1 Tax=Glaciimonas soli TaxID=2590999 RepID=A0A843YQ93_9BURK|nr:hypothetical protein [Glaciimonas soli]MQQ99560.1 hypothetical protein [Glaciimonas soli]
MLRQLLKESWLFKSGIIVLIAGLVALYMGLAGEKALPLQALQVQNATVTKVVDVVERRKRSVVHEWFELTAEQNGAAVVWRIDSSTIDQNVVNSLIGTSVKAWINLDNENEIYQIEVNGKILVAYSQTRRYHKIRTLEDLYLAYFMIILGTLMMTSAALLLRYQMRSQTAITNNQTDKAKRGGAK